MSSLTIKLWGLVNRENNNSINHKIAETLLENMYQLEGTSTADLARLCNVSKPTISRFSRELGYEDYYDFRMDLKIHNDLPDKTSSYADCRDLGLFHAYMDKCRDYMTVMEKNINEMDIGAVARNIDYYKQIYIVGNMNSGSVAQSLQYSLFCSKKMITAITDISEQRKLFEHFTGNEMIIIFSISGRYYIDALKNHIPANTKVYLITTNPEINQIPCITIINARTGDDLAASNTSLSLIANAIYLKYIYYISQ